MARINSTRSGCIDVFNAFLVKNASYDSALEIPRLEIEKRKPTKLIPFSKAARSTEFDAWIHFYEDDVAFERLWNRPNKYLNMLKRFAGVIAPDFTSAFTVICRLFDSHNEPCWYNHEKEKAEKDVMIELISKIKSRLNEINDGSFVVEDLETERLKKL